jgi:hypothetical protein
LHGRSSGPDGERLYADDKGDTDKVYTEVRWPAVVRHPVSGRSILFVNPMHTHGFDGMGRANAWPLIEELAAHSTQERFVYYHRWRVGDVLMWDERATMHRGAGDYRPDERRIMLRTIVYPNARRWSLVTQPLWRAPGTTRKHPVRLPIRGLVASSRTRNAP